MLGEVTDHGNPTAELVVLFVESCVNDEYLHTVPITCVVELSVEWKIPLIDPVQTLVVGR